MGDLPFTVYFDFETTTGDAVFYDPKTELKFTIDTLSDWFSNKIKPNFFELMTLKRTFLEKNPIVPSETTCCICGFFPDVEDCGKHKRWCYFIIDCYYLFLKNIYSEDGLKEMDLETNDKYCGIFNRLVRLFPLFKSAFDDGGNPKNLKVLFVKTLIMLIRLFLN